MLVCSGQSFVACSTLVFHDCSLCLLFLVSLVITKPKVTIHRKESIVMQLNLAIDTIVTIVKEYVTESGAERAVIGVSSGIDSAILTGNHREALGETQEKHSEKAQRSTRRKPGETLGKSLGTHSENHPECKP